MRNIAKRGLYSVVEGTVSEIKAFEKAVKVTGKYSYENPETMTETTKKSEVIFNNFEGEHQDYGNKVAKVNGEDNHLMDQHIIVKVKNQVDAETGEPIKGKYYGYDFKAFGGELYLSGDETADKEYAKKPTTILFGEVVKVSDKKYNKETKAWDLPLITKAGMAGCILTIRYYNGKENVYTDVTLYDSANAKKKVDQYRATNAKKLAPVKEGNTVTYYTVVVDAGEKTEFTRKNGETGRAFNLGNKVYVLGTKQVEVKDKAETPVKETEAKPEPAKEPVAAPDTPPVNETVTGDEDFISIDESAMADLPFFQ